MADIAAHGSPATRSVRPSTAQRRWSTSPNGQRVHAGRRVRRLPHAQDQQGRQPHLPRHEAHAAGRRREVECGGEAVAPGTYLGEDSCSEVPRRAESRTPAAGRHRQVAGDATTLADSQGRDRSPSPPPRPAAEFSPTDSTKPGYMLVGRATWNYKACENDASDGVHNPPTSGRPHEGRAGGQVGRRLVRPVVRLEVVVPTAPASLQARS